MGMYFFGSRCSNTSHNRGDCGSSTQTEYVYVDRVQSNPNPARFNINRILQVGRFLIVEVSYPDCQNYEGKKILVFEGITKANLQELKSLDPHFCPSTVHPSPVARFVPTEKGWRHATIFCQNA